MSRALLFFLLYFASSYRSFIWGDSLSDTLKRKQLRHIITAESVTSAVSLTGLSVLWYSDYPQSGFHFINDNSEWLQMDKCGHMTSSYYIGKIGYELLRLPGVDKRKTIWYGGGLGFAYLGIVELMDGFSAGWGASPGDLAANAAGSVIFIGQQLAWDEQKVILKWSYHNTKYPKYNPGQLGRNLPEKMIKDYNGQTFWLSANIHSFLGKESSFPRWLNIAAGYSADGLTGARFNPSEIDGIQVPSFRRTRQYFLAPDIDLTRIRTRSPFLKMVFNIFGVLKFPLPALEYNSVHGFIFHPAYF